MTDREAMKMALEALEWCLGGEPCGGEDAVRALKERLAQPEQWEQFYPDMGNPLDRMAENARELGLDYEPVQEPVAWTERELKLIDGMIEVQLHHAKQCDGIANRTMAEKQKGWDMERVELLRKIRNTAPQPAVREWQGLTDEEKDAIYRQADAEDWHDQPLLEAVETKLREKNHD